MFGPPTDGNNGWFQRALKAGPRSNRRRGVERDVSFVPPGADEAEPVTLAYHAKYDHYGLEDGRYGRQRGGGSLDAQDHARVANRPKRPRL